MINFVVTGGTVSGVTSNDKVCIITAYTLAKCRQGRHHDNFAETTLFGDDINALAPGRIELILIKSFSSQI